MVEVLGGAMVMVGGGMLTTACVTLARAQRSSIDRATALLGNTDDVVVRAIPASMRALLDELL